MDRTTVAAMIDHTLLRVDATADEVAQLCREANDLEVVAVCVSPSRLPFEDGWLNPGIKTAAVCGFPSGNHQPQIKAAEAELAATAGADEIDMVIDLANVRASWWGAVEAEIRAVRDAVPTVVLKVIIESAALGSAEIVAACEVAELAGADFVKTSTGFHPAGGASLEAVELMAATVGGRLGVKASGGIRTAETALAMIEAGATRLGTSSGAAILDGLA